MRCSLLIGVVVGLCPVIAVGQPQSAAKFVDASIKPARGKNKESRRYRLTLKIARGVQISAPQPQPGFGGFGLKLTVRRRGGKSIPIDPAMPRPKGLADGFPYYTGTIVIPIDVFDTKNNLQLDIAIRSASLNGA